MLDLGITEMARKLIEELQRILTAVALILEQYRSSIHHEVVMLE